VGDTVVVGNTDVVGDGVSIVVLVVAVTIVGFVL
jgi:hypothetical protein